MNNYENLDEKKWHDMTSIIKVISDSVKNYYDSTFKSGDTPSDKDISLIAMQVLSLLCGLSRGYTKDSLNKMWAASINISHKIHESRTEDRIVSKMQLPIGYELNNKN